MMKALMLPAVDKQITLSSFSENLAFAKQRVDSLEQFRIQRALRNCPHSFHYVFAIFPVLIHFNLPTLPAYIENAPRGFFQFSLTDIQRDYLPVELWQTELNTDLPVFDGLYVMGSIGSITQTCLSDLDVWLCHSIEFDEQSLILIEQKLNAIKLWAKQLGVDISFYLMNPKEFKAKEYHSGVTNEHNGSAQHFFLLDEFYRSAIRLAGKRILWSHIDDSQQNYQQIIKQAVLQQELDLNEWLDFGDFSSLSASEYFGATLWQLYKGIQSPFKSAIKILLLESYAKTYPTTNLISKQFKQLLLSENAVNYHFDPYLAMLDQVTTYLLDSNELLRLNHLRSCFYIKASDGQNDQCRKRDLLELAQQWQWNESDLKCLDNRRQWKIKQAMQFQQIIVEQLLRSYRNLIRFARKFQLDPSIMPQDADFLMRKLYSVFEVIPGKVPLINPSIADNLVEDAVTFVEVSEGSATKAGWYLINHAPTCAYDANKRHIQYQKTLIKLIAWAYFNGVINACTKIHLVSSKVKLTTVRQFITDLRLSFPAKTPLMKDDDLYHPNEIRHLIVAVNLVKDPTRHIPPLSKADIEHIDLFNLASSEQGMVGSVSIIYRNMWNEILTQHFEGNEAVLKALKLISNKIYRNSAPPQSVNVFCYSSQLRNQLQTLVMSLVNRCITIQTGSVFQRLSLQTFRMAGKKWQLVFGKNKQLTHIIEQLEFADGNHSTMIESAKVPSEIYHFASEGFIQFFFQDNLDCSFNVYVLDKQNQMECYYHCIGTKEEKVKQITRLYTDELEQTEESFNFPQFYQLLSQNDTICIVPFQSK